MIIYLLRETVPSSTNTILLELQESVLPLVKYTLIILSAILALLLIIYIVSIYIHHRQKKYTKWKTEHCRSLIGSILSGDKPPAGFRLSRRERDCFRDTLIDEYSKQNVSGRDAIRDLYKKLDFYYRDIRLLRHSTWWKKIQAIQRLEAIKMAEAESIVLPLLWHKKSEVRYAALKMLSSIGSDKLGSMLTVIFTDNSRWAYRFLTNALMDTKIPVDSLKPLASSTNRDLRKAAAILLGKAGNRDAISILERLADDKVKDVRREAVRSLGRVGLIDVMPALSSKVDDNNPQVRAVAASAFGVLKDTNSLSLLERLADDPDFDVRFQAFLALEQFGQSGSDIIAKYEFKYPEMVREFVSKVGSTDDAA